MNFRITAEIFLQIAETVYAELFPGGSNDTNWTALTQDERNEFRALTWEKLDQLRRGILDDFAAPFTGAVYGVTQHIMGQQWLFMAQQGLTLDAPSDEVQAALDQIQNRKLADAAAEAVSDGEQLQGSVSEGGQEPAGEVGTVETGDRNLGIEEDRPKNPSKNRPRKGQLESKPGSTGPDATATSTAGTVAD